jgi:inorganic triphosphatase YgiF
MARSKPPNEAPLPLEEPRETELKLVLAPELAERLLESPLLQKRLAAPARSQKLASVYWDTPERRLSGRGLALRVRRVGHRHIQTLKTASREIGAVRDRGEWEVALPGALPDLTAFEDPRLVELTGLVLPEELVPAFETRVQRTVMPIRWVDGDGRGALIELAHDRGAITAGGRSEAIVELELELKEGPRSALFELVRAIRELVPVRFSTAEKAARGYRLLDGTPPAIHRGTKLDLDPEATVEEVMAAVFASCVDQAVANEAAAVDGRDIEGVHQLRVAFRRLRSALKLFEDLLPPADVARWTAEIRWLVGCLGPARDLDVLVDELLAPLRGTRTDDPALGAFEAAAAAHRETLQAAVREGLGSERAGDLLLRLTLWVELRGWRQGVAIEALLAQRRPIAELAGAELDRSHHRVIKRGRRFARLDVAGRHRLRIALKKLRYGVEFFRSLYPKKDLKPYLAVVQQLQDELGHLNDVAVSDRLVREIRESLGTGADRQAVAEGGGMLVGWYSRAVEDIAPGVLESWRAFKALERFWAEGTGER